MNFKWRTIDLPRRCLGELQTTDNKDGIDIVGEGCREPPRNEIKWTDMSGLKKK